MNRRGLGVALCLALCLAGALASLWRVGFHASRELAQSGEPVSLPADGRSVLLTEARLFAGQRVVFELCAGDALPPARWRDAAAFEIVERAAGEQVLAGIIDELRLAHARRDAHAGCLTLASASSLGVDGLYALRARATADDGALTAVPAVGRIVASAPMGGLDLAPLALLALASLSLVVLCASARPPSAPSEARIRLLARAALAFSLVGGLLFGVGLLPLPAPYGALAGASLLAGGQLLAALGLSTPRGAPRLAGLGLGLPPGRARWLLAAAPLIGLALVVAGRYVGGLFPSTSTSPIETFVSSGSGYLTVATSSLLLPIFEELFFRGLLYGLLTRAAGPTLAFALVALAFPLMHLPQVYGAWGALASLTLTGLTLTALRAASGSLAPAMLAHLVHNALICLGSFPLG